MSVRFLNFIEIILIKLWKNFKFSVNFHLKFNFFRGVFQSREKKNIKVTYNTNLVVDLTFRSGLEQVISKVTSSLTFVVVYMGLVFHGPLKFISTIKCLKKLFL